MMEIDFAPLALQDITTFKQYLQEEFGTESAKRLINKLFNSISNLSFFPDEGNDLLKKYDIQSDYLTIITCKHYVFYRIENNKVKIIRVLDEKQDFLKILFGIDSSDSESEEYWNE